MAKLSRFTLNRDTVAQGDRIEVGPPGNSFFLTTRGFTPAYRDALHDLARESARRLNADLAPRQIPVTPADLPPSEDDRNQGIALAQHCVLGVEGLEHDDGSPVTVQTLRDMLVSGEHQALMVMCLRAAGQVGDQRARKAKDDAGN